MRQMRYAPTGKQRTLLCAAFAILAALLALPSYSAAQSQDWFRTGTGLGVSKPRVAVSDFVSRSAPVQSLNALFSDVVRNDLDYSGILELASKSFYPTQVPSAPSELNYPAWQQPPVSAQFLAFGNLTSGGTDLSIEAWFYDVQNVSAPPVVGRVYRGQATAADTRKFAHQFADEIIARLSGGVPGIASTQIAFVSQRTGNKELWVMDYDGQNQHQITFLHSISLMPRWSPDASRIAFTCYPTGIVSSAQICMYSMLTNKVVSWPRFAGTNSSPAWSPDGTKIMFMSSMFGNPELFTTDAEGGHIHRITHSVGANTSPSWNPKTGDQVAFVSDRSGTPQIFTMDAEGGEAQRLKSAGHGLLNRPGLVAQRTVVGLQLATSQRQLRFVYDGYRHARSGGVDARRRTQ